MLGFPQSQRARMQREASTLASRGRHRAEQWRESLPEAGELLSDLREQAEPVVKAARDRAEQARPGKRRRSRRPLLIIGVLALGALVAFLIFRRRDEEPARLMGEPGQPETPTAGEPAPGGATNGTWGNEPGHVSEAMIQSTAPEAAPSPRPSPFGGLPGDTGSPPSPRAAAWDLPPVASPSGGWSHGSGLPSAGTPRRS